MAGASTPPGERLARLEERIEGMSRANAQEHLHAAADREDMKLEIAEIRKTLENLTKLLDQARGARFVIGFLVFSGTIVGGIMGSKFMSWIWQAVMNASPR